MKSSYAGFQHTRRSYADAGCGRSDRSGQVRTGGRSRSSPRVQEQPLASTPEFWLGMSDGQPVDWGGPKRRCFVVNRPLLATGRRAWRVNVAPKLGLPFSSGSVGEVIVTERYSGESLEGLEDDWVTVNVAAYATPEAAGRDQFRDGDLDLIYVAEAAASPELLPDAFDVERFWELSLARIKRFIARHGHSRVPEGYHDEDGRLEILVDNIRFHHAGKAGISEGPFPGIDYAAVLDELPGWEWNADEGEQA